MRIDNINTHIPSFKDESPWQQLLDYFSQVNALWTDMEKNPQNAMGDLQKMIDLAEKMEAIADKLPSPPSAPNFHKDFQVLLSSLEQLKSSLLGNMTHNPDVEVEMKNIIIELDNIKRDILQG